MAGFTSSLGLVLEQSGVEITGYLTIAGPGATSVVVPITTGRARVSGFEIDCDETVDVAGTPQAIELELDGTRDGDTLSGTGRETVGGVTHAFDWTAQLSTPPPAP
jgi:hypothetical protein